MRKLICILLVMAQMLVFFNAAYAKTGDIIGYAVHTDIVATINGAQIQSYNYKGNTYVVAEDLAGYGFNVVWNAVERTLTITRNYNVRTIYSNYQKPYVSQSQIGKKAYNILESDIAAVVNGYYAGSYSYIDWIGAYNIDGRTIIPFNLLETFGTVQWNPNSRIISLQIPGVGNMGSTGKDAWTAKNEFTSRMNAIDSKYGEILNSAMSQYEINSASSLGYCMWDGLLNEVYQYLKLNRLSAQEFENLKNDEIRWINEKEQAIQNVEQAYMGGSIRPFMANDTAIEYTRNRCAYLISLI